MYKAKLNNLLTYALPFLIGGVMLNKFNVYFILLWLLIYLLTIERIEAAVSFAIILPPFIGSIFQVYHIPIPGSLLSLFIAVGLAFPFLGNLNDWDFRQVIKYIFPITLVCVLFYVFTGATENSTSKIVGLLITVFYSPFLFFISESEEISTDRLAPVFIIYALLMIRVAYDFYGYSAPTGLFDFTSFRLGGYANVQNGTTHVNYQNVGIAGLMATAYWLSSRNNIRNTIDYIILFSSMWIVLISGARQAIFGLIIIIGIWLLCRNGAINIKGVLLFIAFMVLSALAIKFLNIEFISSMFEDRDNIDRDYSYPLYIIFTNTLTGIGFGNYWDPVNDLYFAHNLFLEILCEMGVLGFVLIFIPVLVFLLSDQKDFSRRFSNGALSLVIFLPYFIRAMISDDLSRNIIVFITFFIFFRKQNTNHSFDNN